MGSDGLVRKLFSGFCILQRRVVARHRRSQSAPSDSIARLVQATQRPLQADNAGQKIFLRDFAICKSQSGGHGSAQRPFSMDVPGLESRRTFFHEESADFVVFRFGPDHGYVSDRAAGDPHLFTVEDVFMALLDGTGQHSAGIRTKLRLRQSEAAYGLALLQKREPFVLLRLAAIGINRIHHQRTLHGNKTAEAGIASLQFLSHQSVRDIGHSRAAVTVQVRAKKSQLTELGINCFGNVASRLCFSMIGTISFSTNWRAVCRTSFSSSFSCESKSM